MRHSIADGWGWGWGNSHLVVVGLGLWIEMETSCAESVCDERLQEVDPIVDEKNPFSQSSHAYMRVSKL